MPAKKSKFPSASNPMRYFIPTFELFLIVIFAVALSPGVTFNNLIAPSSTVAVPPLANVPLLVSTNEYVLPFSSNTSPYSSYSAE